MEDERSEKTTCFGGSKVIPTTYTGRSYQPWSSKVHYSQIYMYRVTAPSLHPPYLDLRAFETRNFVLVDRPKSYGWISDP